MTTPMTRAELLALPPAVDLVTAGRALGISRWKAFELAKQNAMPIPVLKLGHTYRVPSAAILKLLCVSRGAGDDDSTMGE
jgi:hypothetical protein